MRTVNLRLKRCVGKVLYAPVYDNSGRRLLPRGHLLSAQDADVLDVAGLNELWVVELDTNEVSEDEAVARVAEGIGTGSVDIQLSVGGRANLFAKATSCVMVNGLVLKELNGSTDIVIATLRNFAYASSGRKIASVKSCPFAVQRTELERVLEIVQAQGPILDARAIGSPSVSELFTDDDDGQQAYQMFGKVLDVRLENLELKRLKS